MGPLPRESLALARELRARTIFVRGNAERALSELAGAPGEAATPRERWLLERHDDEERAFLASFVEGAMEMVELLERPPTPAEVVEDAEAKEFAG